jgi:hypothetical protein
MPLHARAGDRVITVRLPERIALPLDDAGDLVLLLANKMLELSARYIDNEGWLMRGSQRVVQVRLIEA